MYFVCMQWIFWSLAQCISIECSGLHAAWLKSYRLNAVDSMQRDWMQWIPCTVKNGILLNAVDFMQYDLMQWIPCSMFECSGFYAAWPKPSLLNAVESMQRHWMQRIPCIVAQWIPIVCSGVHAARPKAPWLNAVDFMQHGPNHPDWMQWIPCIVIECSELHAVR